MNYDRRMAMGAVELAWIGAQERGLELLDGVGERLRQQRGQGRTAAHLLTGMRGERAALFALRRRGYTVVAARWRSAKAPGDIDLVAWDGGTLCFVEVKTRTVRDMTPADSAVDEGKRRTMRRLARLYRATLPEGERDRVPVRFDVVSVYGTGRTAEVQVLAGAFGW